MKGDETPLQEIVIIRRGGGDDQAAAKGGAWKIAYADFVTAMMAFFLVMWLINASNEETRAQVASYFNPIKLTESTTGSRSLKDLKENRTAQKPGSNKDTAGTPPSTKASQEEAELLANPPLSLDHIALTVSEAEFRNAGLESTLEIAPALKPDKANPGIGDPFDPHSWEKAKEIKASAVDDSKNAVPDGDKTSSSAAKPAEQSGATRNVSALKRDIDQEIGSSDDQLRRAVEVAQSSNGILISLTESESFEMFSTGSAKPEPKLLKLVEAVARALLSRPGHIIIRGHTDSRPYRNKYYDNWQLSTARAHLARYMLISGGLPEQRISRVEGVADREPHNKDDPQAAVNRRIEILLETAIP